MQAPRPQPPRSPWHFPNGNAPHCGDSPRICGFVGHTCPSMGRARPGSFLWGVPSALQSPDVWSHTAPSLPRMWVRGQEPLTLDPLCHLQRPVPQRRGVSAACLAPPASIFLMNSSRRSLDPKGVQKAAIQTPLFTEMVAEQLRGATTTCPRSCRQ